MYQLYQNKYSNYLNLNLIKVRYTKEKTIVNQDFAIKLSDNYDDKANDLITFKLHLFLSALACQNSLKERIIIIDTNTLKSALKIGKKRYIEEALNYLKAITFRYNYFISKSEKTNKWKTEIRECKIIDYYNSSKGYIKIKLNEDYIKLLGYKIKTCKEKQYVELPKELFTLDIKNYRHSVFLGYYILLNQKRNYSNARKNIVSVKELVKYCPLLKSYDDLGKEKQITRTIIEPFKNNMNYLANQFNFKWQFSNEVNTYLSFLNNKIIFASKNWGYEYWYWGCECRLNFHKNL